jgi:hypothetical protein
MPRGDRHGRGDGETEQAGELRLGWGQPFSGLRLTTGPVKRDDPSKILKGRQMPTQCQHCGSQVEESAVVCVHCGQATDAPVPAAPPASTSEHTPVPAGFEQQPTAPLFSAVGDSADRGLTGIGGWLILPAIGLALNPFIQRSIGIYTDLNVLLLQFGSEGQIALGPQAGARSQSSSSRLCLEHCSSSPCSSSF